MQNAIICPKTAAVGLSQTSHPEELTDSFLEQVRHNNEVFSAFRTHRMQNDIARQLTDGKGHLKSFQQFSRDVEPLTGKYCRNWLQTEYNTAVIRAHRAADWKHFETEKDVYPNLRWMPTTSAEADPVHASFWSRKLTLPVDDPFWGHHHPGERWGCKCTCEQTDEPVNDLGMNGHYPDTASKGLHGNPAETGHLFSEDHPYYPKNCGSCPFSSGVRNMAGQIFNAKKDCSKCKVCTESLMKMPAKNQQPNEYYTEPKYGERMKICKGADQSELEDNKRCLGALLDSFPDMKAVIRKHVAEFGVKNPEYVINGLVADRKGIESDNGIKAGFNRALKQGCQAIVLDYDMYLRSKPLHSSQIARMLENRYDFNKEQIQQCYIVYKDKSVLISCEQKNRAEMTAIIENFKAGL